jgi:hypothetical protein
MQAQPNVSETGEGSGQKRARVQEDESSSQSMAGTMQLDSGKSFADFHTGQHVTVAHSDHRHADVALWRAKITAAREGEDHGTGTFDVLILELNKSVSNVDPKHIFTPSHSLPAV